ncbi:hypothetical protein P4S64_24865 [Vibrio sp. M60_M31a]
MKCQLVQNYLGRVVNTLGEPIDGKGPIEAKNDFACRSDRTRCNRP